MLIMLIEARTITVIGIVGDRAERDVKRRDVEIGNVGWTSGAAVCPSSASRLEGQKTGFGETLKTEDG